MDVDLPCLRQDETKRHTGCFLRSSSLDPADPNILCGKTPLPPCAPSIRAFRGEHELPNCPSLRGLLTYSLLDLMAIALFVTRPAGRSRHHHGGTQKVWLVWDGRRLAAGARSSTLASLRIFLDLEAKTFQSETSGLAQP